MRVCMSACVCVCVCSIICYVVESSNFLTECFFITQRALHVGLISAISNFESRLRYSIVTVLFMTLSLCVK